MTGRVKDLFNDAVDEANVDIDDPEDNDFDLTMSYLIKGIA